MDPKWVGNWGKAGVLDTRWKCPVSGGVRASSRRSRLSFLPLDTGGYSWGLGPVSLAPLASSSGSSSSDAQPEPAGDEIQQTAEHIAGALGGLFTPLLLRGILAFVVWWTAACQLVCSLSGLYLQQHMAGC